MKKSFALFGIIAPLSYVLAVIIGGFLLDGYSHMYNSISELTASNVNKIPIIFILFAVYNLSIMIFGFGLYTDVKLSSTIKGRIASLLLIAVGVMGIAMLYFVQDPRNIPMSFGGKIHLALAGISSFLTMAVIILTGLCFKDDNRLKKYALYSFISFGVVFISGGITGMSVANNSPFGGLFERITIGAFMQWIFVIAVFIIRRGNEIRKRDYKSMQSIKESH